jgi:glycosyltransferase involved in cell wall biosynthesis
MNRKLKILWFSNFRFSNEAIKTTGTWLKVMGEGLSIEKEVEFVNVTKGQSKEIIFEQINCIKQYVVPAGKSYSNDLPKPQITSQIENIIEEVKPDIIHVWGTESYWGLITKKYVHRFKVLLEIQGILTQIRVQFYGELTPREILACTGLKEFVRPKTHILFQHFFYIRQAQNEQEIVRSHQLIGVQSEWSHRSIVGINSKAKIFKGIIPLRVEFVSAARTWSHQSSGKIFTSAAGLHSFKGLHVTLRALKILVDKGLNVCLNIAGAQSRGFRQSGYKRYLLALINELKIESHVNWLGALDAMEIVHELQSSDVVLISSYMESYCMVLYEALAVGVPIVCSYAGAMPEAGRLSSSIKYFQPGDFTLAASHVSDVLCSAYESNFDSPPVFTAEAAVKRQLEIYNEINIKIARAD